MPVREQAAFGAVAIGCFILDPVALKFKWIAAGLATAINFHICVLALRLLVLRSVCAAVSLHVVL
jgi:hypothetical protein